MPRRPTAPSRSCWHLRAMQQQNVAHLRLSSRHSMRNSQGTTGNRNRSVRTNKQADRLRQALPDLFVQHSVHRTTAGQDQRVDCLTFRHEVCDRRSHVRENFPLEDLLPKQSSRSTLMQKRTDSSVTAPLTGWLTCEAAKSRAAARPSFPLKPRPSLKFWFNTQSRLPRWHSLRKLELPASE